MMQPHMCTRYDVKKLINYEDKRVRKKSHHCVSAADIHTLLQQLLQVRVMSVKTILNHDLHSTSHLCFFAIPSGCHVIVL